MLPPDQLDAIAPGLGLAGVTPSGVAVIARNLVMPWADLDAQAVPEDYLQLHPELLATVSSLVGMGPDRPRLLKTDQVSNLRTTTQLNGVQLLTNSPAQGSNLVQVGDLTMFPPGTYVALIPAAGVSVVTPDLVYQVTAWSGKFLKVAPNLAQGYVINDFAIAIGSVAPVVSIQPQVVIGSVGPIANGSTGSSTFSIPRGVQTLGFHFSSTGGIGNASLFQVQGVSTRANYFNALGSVLGGAISWAAVDSAEDTQITLTVTPPNTPGGTATGFLVGSYSALPNTQQVVVPWGSQNQPLLQRTGSFDLQVQLRNLGTEYAANDPSDRLTRLLGLVRLADVNGVGLAIVNFGDGAGSTLRVAVGDVAKAGQQVIGNSLPVVVASDQPPTPWQAPTNSIGGVGDAPAGGTVLIAAAAGKSIYLHGLSFSIDAAVAGGWWRLRSPAGGTVVFESGSGNPGQGWHDFRGMKLSAGNGLDIALSAPMNVRLALDYSQA